MGKLNDHMQFRNFPGRVDREYQVMVSDDFSNMFVRDAGISKLVGNNNYLKNLVSKSDYALKISQRGIERESLALKKALISTSADNSSNIVDHQNIQLVKNPQLKKMLKNKPLLKKFMSKESHK